MASDGFPYPVDVPGNFSADDSPTAEQLKPFGYAPGSYEMKCPVCRAPAYNVDKRAMRCWQCAVNAFRAKEVTAQTKAPLQDEDELAGILHKAFSHPDAVDHSNEVVGLPMLIRTKGGWYVLGEDGMRFNLVCASREPKAYL